MAPLRHSQFQVHAPHSVPGRARSPHLDMARRGVRPGRAPACRAGGRGFNLRPSQTKYLLNKHFLHPCYDDSPLLPKDNDELAACEDTVAEWDCITVPVLVYPRGKHYEGALSPVGIRPALISNVNRTQNCNHSFITSGLVPWPVSATGRTGKVQI